MTFPTLRRLFPSIALFGLAACGSTPQTQFYTLVAAGQAPAPRSGAFQLEVMPVDIPQQVVTPQLVVRDSDGRMSLLEGQRWIAPLDAEIRSALSADLSGDLGVRDVYGLSLGDYGKTYRVTLKVQRFESAPGAYARIDAIWTVSPPDTKDGPHPLACSSSISRNVGAGYDALAQGHQQAIALIARQIAQVIAASQSGGVSPGCP